MISKLLKYELKATSRIFLPSYGVLFVLGIINHFLSFDIDNLNVAGVVSSIIYSMVLTAVIVIAIIVIIQRFYKNLLSNEGYLMFSLPVKSWHLVASKLLASLIWIVLGVLTGIITIILLAGRGGSLVQVFELIGEAFATFKSFYPGNHILLLVQFFLFTFSYLIMFILVLFCSLAIGQLSNNHKILLAAGAYLGFETVGKTVVTFLFMVTFKYLTFPNVLSTIWAGIGAILLISVGLFLLTTYLLNKKLNLE